jgi:hypothetical protein
VLDGSNARVMATRMQMMTMTRAELIEREGIITHLK